MGDRIVPDAPALAALARAECGPEGPSMSTGRPCAWVPALVAEGALEQRLAVALAAAFLQHPEPATVCEGARLAVRLADPVLGPIVLRALRDHDTALLLQVDPGDPTRSVEDTLLQAAPTLVDLSDPALRRPLLARLRDAGLPELEVSILAAHGDEDDLRAWLPAVLAEGLSIELRARLEERARGDDEGAAVVASMLVSARRAALPSASG